MCDLGVHTPARAAQPRRPHAARRPRPPGEGPRRGGWQRRRPPPTRPPRSQCVTYYVSAPLFAGGPRRTRLQSRRDHRARWPLIVATRLCLGAASCVRCPESIPSCTSLDSTPCTRHGQRGSSFQATGMPSRQRKGRDVHELGKRPTGRRSVCFQSGGRPSGCPVRRRGHCPLQQ